jgi:membrane-associated phospholipid phosphatase
MTETPRYPPARLPATPWLLGAPAVVTLIALAIALAGITPELFAWLNTLGRGGYAALWAHLTMLGEGLVAVALIGPLARWRPELGWSLLIAAVLATVAVHGIKEITDLPRPAAVIPPAAIHIIGPDLYIVSFPSGHATTIATFCAVLGFHLPDKRWRGALVVPAVLVALSRVVVGAHWPVDVLGGLVLGWFVAAASVWLAQRWPWGTDRGWQLGIRLLSLAGAVLLWDAPTHQDLAQGFQKLISAAGMAAGVWALWGLWRPIGGHPR